VTTPSAASGPDDLAALLSSLSTGGSDLSILGFDQRELQRLLDSIEHSIGLADQDDIPSLTEEPVTKPGDLRLLGQHRILCGDATNEHDVAMVMGDEKAACVWTDPPYGVEYVGGAKKALTIKNDNPNGLNQLLDFRSLLSTRCSQTAPPSTWLIPRVPSP
jgi:hypothetical protein